MRCQVPSTQSDKSWVQAQESTLCKKGVFFGGGGVVKTISNHLSQILQNWKLCALGIIFFGLLSYTCIRWALNSQPHSPCFQGE